MGYIFSQEMGKILFREKRPNPMDDPQGSPMAPEPPEVTLGRHFPSQVAEITGRVVKY